MPSRKGVKNLLYSTSLFHWLIGTLKGLVASASAVKNLKELFLMVSSVGVDDDDEVLGLKLLVVGG